jgi:hypothetical protein
MRAAVRAEAYHGRPDLSYRLDRGDIVYPVVLGPALTRGLVMETAVPVPAARIETPTDFVHWGTIIAGALIAAALFFVLVSFGASLGLSVVSAAPTWRDTSPTLTALSGLYLLLTAIVSFGFGGYIAGRLRKTWDIALHSEFAEFRDGAHGLLAWALAVVISASIVAAVAAAASPKAFPATTPAANTGEALFPYDLDRLFRSDKRDQGNLAYSRAEASRILLTANSRTGMKPDDRSYLARLVASQTGIAQPEADRRVEEAITAASLAVKRARQSAVILGFSVAVSLLLGAAVAWYASSLGGQHRDQAAPPLRWNLAPR